MTHNRLANEPSPYLVQHKDNPVHWYPWGEEAFEDAKKEGKPVLLSVGYAACHWCHVMAHESFEDDDTAAVMNDLFINIKLDREERPDIDKIYMEALQHLGEPGGWPLTMFLTPDRAPFWGGTYFPKTAQYGRPGFVDVLRQVAHIYHEEHEKIENNAKALTAALQRRPRNQAGHTLSLQELDDSALRIHSIIDMEHGGLTGAPKFPQVPLFEYLWRHYLRTGNQHSKAAVFTTLMNVSQGGIYDHLGGGFARYSVDERWLAPHFEKMLYDNAQLIRLLLYVWQDTGEELFRQRIEETVTWLSREMITEHGAFAASLDADSEGEEGKFYVWDKAEITAILGRDAEDFYPVYDVTEVGNWEGHTILNRLGQTDTASADALKGARQKLLSTREKRIRPGLDDKVLTDWNGLMISALADCARALNQSNWLELAQTAYSGVKTALWTDDGFAQSYRSGQRRHRATADGYANMSSAALALYQSTADEDYVIDAVTWTNYLEKHFWNEETGGYFLTHDEATDVIRRTLLAHDDATPNANATMLQVHSRLYLVTGDESHRLKMDQILSHFTDEVFANLIAHAGFTNGYEDAISLIQIIVTGDDDLAGEFSALVDTISLPNLFVDHVKDARTLSDTHPAKAKAESGTTAVFICKGQTCSLPITAIDDLKSALNTL